MGGTTFFTHGEGKTPEEAFNAAREKALYDYGHRGYTGTIAEKRSFVVIRDTLDDVKKRIEQRLPSADSWEKSSLERLLKSMERIKAPHAQVAEALIELCDPRIDDKWGDAGCIALGEGKYLFFGWASD